MKRITLYYERAGECSNSNNRKRTGNRVVKGKCDRSNRINHISHMFPLRSDIFLEILKSGVFCLFVVLRAAERKKENK